MCRSCKEILGNIVFKNVLNNKNVIRFAFKINSGTFEVYKFRKITL